MSEKFLKKMIAATGILLVALLLVMVVLAFSPKEEERSLAEGIAFLESMELKKPSLTEPTTLPPVEQNTDVYQPTEPLDLPPEQLELAQKIRNDEVDIWTLFDDYVMMGDSRAVGYWYYDFLPEERCLTGGGDTIRNIEVNMEALLALSPKYIFLCYGINDVSIGFWDTPEEYVEEMMQIIDDLEAKIPGTTVIVGSILPARDPAFELSSKWYNIPDFNLALSEACAENGVIFVNNDAISNEYADWWQPDGIHIRPEFYPYWAKNLMLGIIEGGAYE